jgi:hypothetical protein
MRRLVLGDESHDRARFPRVQDGISSCRLGQGTKESAGKRDGTAATHMEHAYLTWTLSDAAGLFLRDLLAGQQSLARLEQNHGTGQARPSLAVPLPTSPWRHRA